MAKTVTSNKCVFLLCGPKPMMMMMASSSRPLVTLFLSSKPRFLNSISFSTTATRYPLQYDLIVSRPVRSPQRRRSPLRAAAAAGPNQPNSEMGLQGWVDHKLSSEEKNRPPTIPVGEEEEMMMDKSKHKYYRKRRKRMYGSSDSDSERPQEEKFVELEQEVVDFPRLHKREEELYFYDAFAYPWEKDKHYKMVYQLEKKYFPHQCFDKAFVDPGQHNDKEEKKSQKVSDDRGAGEKNVNDKVVVNNNYDGNKGLVFFEDLDKGDKGSVKDVTEKKVVDLFKCLKKVPNKDAEPATTVQPYIVDRNTELPPRWDGPHGTVVLVNKPKGWTSFTVCGKLRRLVNVKKVGHAGTLDPMATGLLIVCIGKATKVVDRFQGMIKGYGGVFRLGEATSTWDADSPVIQREPWEHIKDDNIKKIAASFCGEIWQVPPMFSAIKVGGEKMYEKARRGETVELSPRRISIFQFEIERSLTDRQNLIFRVICSKGTYIRSLCADFGKSLGSCAHLTALRRDSIGQYKADDAWEFQDLEEAITKGYF